MHGVAAAQVSLVEVRDVRHSLELRTAELFAQSRCDDQAGEMVAAAQSVRAFGDDLDQLVAMDIRFRQAIARASGKRTSTRSSARSNRSCACWRPARGIPRVTAEMLDIHAGIGSGIAARNADTAIAGMFRHFDTSIGDLLSS